MRGSAAMAARAYALRAARPAVAGPRGEGDAHQEGGPAGASVPVLGAAYARAPGPVQLCLAPAGGSASTRNGTMGRVIVGVVLAVVLVLVIVAARVRLRAGRAREAALEPERARLAAEGEELRARLAERVAGAGGAAPFRPLVDAAEDWIWACDEDGTLTFSNPAGANAARHRRPRRPRAGRAHAPGRSAGGLDGRRAAPARRRQLAHRRHALACTSRAAGRGSTAT